MKNVFYIVFFTMTMFFSISNHVSAQETRLNPFYISETSRDGFAVRSAETQGHVRFGAFFSIDYAHDPLVLERSVGDSSSESLSVIGHQLTGNVQLSIGLFNNLVFFAGLPVNLMMQGDSVIDIDGVASADDLLIGDPSIGMRVRLHGQRQDPFVLSLQGVFTLPLAEAVSGSQSYVGESFSTFHPQILMQFRAKKLRILTNIGLRFRSNQEIFNVKIGDEFTFGLGGMLEIINGLDIVAELYGSTSMQDFGSRTVTPIALLGGVKYIHSSSGLVLGATAGPGIARGYGSPDFRAALTIGWTQPEIATTGVLPEEITPPENNEENTAGTTATSEQSTELTQETINSNLQNSQPTILDRDQDGVADAIDNCPDELGSTDFFGCRTRQLAHIDGTQIKVSYFIFFEPNRAVLQERSFLPLDHVSQILRAHPEITRVRVESHTDGRSQNTNDQAQASAVVRYLVEHGIAQERLEAMGLGFTRPLIPDAITPEEYMLNQRIEFHIERTENANVPNTTEP